MNLADGLRITGAAGGMLTITNANPAIDFGSYDVLISNACGSEVIAPASLQFIGKFKHILTMALSGSRLGAFSSALSEDLNAGCKQVHEPISCDAADLGFLSAAVLIAVERDIPNGYRHRRFKILRIGSVFSAKETGNVRVVEIP